MQVIFQNYTHLLEKRVRKVKLPFQPQSLWTMNEGTHHACLDFTFFYCVACFLDLVPSYALPDHLLVIKQINLKMRAVTH